MSNNETTHTFPPEANNGNDFCTIQSLLDNLSTFGLPHFQRGSVWNDFAIGKLLESLALGTPCGSIIMWVPVDLKQNIKDYGDQVPAWQSKSLSDIEYLVVDGQQRLTSLAKVFLEQPEVSETKSRWGINITQIPGIRNLINQETWAEIPKDLHKRNLFSKIPALPATQDTTFIKKKRQIAYYIPLSDATEKVFDLNTYVRQAGVFKVDHTASPQISATKEIYEVIKEFIDAVRNIKNVKLQTVIKRTAITSGGSITDIIDLYNRINSSGIVVKEEERVFASMVKTGHFKMSWLEEVFSSVHPENEHDRNDILKRQRESNLGFKMFIQTFAQVLSHHMYKSKYDLAKIDAYIESVIHSDKNLEDIWPKIFDETKSIITRMARVLRVKLYCDDYRFFPTALGLRPIVTLLVKYPTISDHNLTAMMMVCQLPKDVVSEQFKKEHKFMEAIVNSQTLGAALKLFPSIQFEKFPTSLAKANSIQNPWMSLLYWLQRYKQAGDYTVANTPLINKSSNAQKEHLVSFSYLKTAYKDLEQSNRSSRHDANSIGNITFLSASGNMEKGQTAIDLSNTLPESQKEAHMLDSDTLRAYDILFDNIEKHQSLANLEGTYTKFLDARLKVLAHEFTSWFQSVQVDLQDNEQLATPPALQLINPTRTDIIRKHKWDKAFKTSFINLFTLSGGFSGDFAKLYHDGVTKTAEHNIRLRYKSEAKPCIVFGTHVLKHHPELEVLRSFIEQSVESKYKNGLINSNVGKWFNLYEYDTKHKFTKVIEFCPTDEVTIQMTYTGTGNFSLDGANSVLYMNYMTDLLPKIQTSTYKPKILLS